MEWSRGTTRQGEATCGGLWDLTGKSTCARASASHCSAHCSHMLSPSIPRQRHSPEIVRSPVTASVEYPQVHLVPLLRARQRPADQRAICARREGNGKLSSLALRFFVRRMPPAPLRGGEAAAQSPARPIPPLFSSLSKRQSNDVWLSTRMGPNESAWKCACCVD